MRAQFLGQAFEQDLLAQAEDFVLQIAGQGIGIEQHHFFGSSGQRGGAGLGLGIVFGLCGRLGGGFDLFGYVLIGRYRGLCAAQPYGGLLENGLVAADAQGVLGGQPVFLKQDLRIIQLGFGAGGLQVVLLLPMLEIGLIGLFLFVQAQAAVAAAAERAGARAGVGGLRGRFCHGRGRVKRCGAGFGNRRGGRGRRWVGLGHQGVV